MPQYELGDPLNQIDGTLSKSDASDQLCVTSMNQTKPAQQFKRFIECDTASKYVKNKRQIKYGSKWLPSSKSDSKKSSIVQSDQQQSENSKGSANLSLQSNLIQSIADSSRNEDCIDTSKSHILTYVQNSENYKVTQIQKMWNRLHMTAQSSQNKIGQFHLPARGAESSLISMLQNCSRPASGASQPIARAIGLMPDPSERRYSHKGDNQNEQEFQVFYKIEKINKKIWPSKSVLGKRFKQNISAFYDKFKVAKTQHVATPSLISTSSPQQPTRAICQPKTGSVQETDILRNNQSNFVEEINDSNILEQQTQIVQRIVNLIQQLPMVQDESTVNQEQPQSTLQIETHGSEACDLESEILKKPQQQKEGNYTPSNETRDTQQCSPDLPVNKLPSIESAGSQNLDLLMEYLQSQQSGQHTEMQQLFENLNTGTTSPEQDEEKVQLNPIVIQKQQKTCELNVGSIPLFSKDDVDNSHYQEFQNLEIVKSVVQQQQSDQQISSRNQDSSSGFSQHKQVQDEQPQPTEAVCSPDFNQRTADIFSQTQSFMKMIVQFLQQMDPASQNVSAKLEDLISLTGQPTEEMNELSDVKNTLKESLNNIQNQVHDHVLAYIMGFQMDGLPSEQQETHQMFQRLQESQQVREILSAASESN